MGITEVAKQLVQPGKGILAIDESTPTIGKRLAKYGIENNESNRRDYRELFLTSKGIGSYLAGVILYKETLHQSASDGTPFVSILEAAGILPGVKVDEGLEPLDGCDGESHTKGLENLSKKCEAYARQGAKFTKWRAALAVGNGRPSKRAIEVNAEELASYAAISQANGLVPIVEPEILIDGDYSVEESAAAATAILEAVVASLRKKEVNLEACLLKIQMILPGSGAPRLSSKEIAENTLTVLSRCVPEELPGVVFLSGGQSEEEATLNLNEINTHAKAQGKLKCRLTFSYGRSLQASVLDIWSKNTAAPDLKAKAQELALALAAANAAASVGSYQGPHPSVTAGKSLNEAFRGWT